MSTELVSGHRAQEMLSRLQLRRIRREKDQVDVLGHPQAETRVPASPIQDEHDLFGGTRAGLARKGSQFHFEEGDADGRGQMEERAPRGGMDDADEVAPFETMAHGSQGALPNRCPDPTQEGFEADRIPAKVVQEMLGHSNIGMTLDIYSHVLPDMQTEAADSLDDLLGQEE
ncbi:MAG TPA: hypothetical protein VGP82_16310 [Ktedonobacterales bacterium]|nr:hypothetical protein [Ktedonobacterales bacterium]